MVWAKTRFLCIWTTPIPRRSIDREVMFRNKTQFYRLSSSQGQHFRRTNRPVVCTTARIWPLSIRKSLVVKKIHYIQRQLHGTICEPVFFFWLFRTRHEFNSMYPVMIFARSTLCTRGFWLETGQSYTNSRVWIVSKKYSFLWKR